MGMEVRRYENRLHGSEKEWDQKPHSRSSLAWSYSASKAGRNQWTKCMKCELLCVSGIVYCHFGCSRSVKVQQHLRTCTTSTTRWITRTRRVPAHLVMVRRRRQLRRGSGRKSRLQAAAWSSVCSRTLTGLGVWANAFAECVTRRSESSGRRGASRNYEVCRLRLAADDATSTALVHCNVWLRK